MRPATLVILVLLFFFASICLVRADQQPALHTTGEKKMAMSRAEIQEMMAFLELQKQMLADSPDAPAVQFRRFTDMAVDRGRALILSQGKSIDWDDDKVAQFVGKSVVTQLQYRVELGEGEGEWSQWITLPAGKDIPHDYTLDVPEWQQRKIARSSKTTAEMY